MVVTMLEGRVPEENAAGLIDRFGGVGDALPPFIVESFLIHAAGSDLWKILTVWESQDDLDEYRASVETPEGVRMFRSAGAEPTWRYSTWPLTPPTPRRLLTA